MPEIVLGSNSSIISKADVVIAIDGGRKTYEGALSAQIANKTVIPVGSFGGAGHNILQRVYFLPSSIEVCNSLSIHNMVFELIERLLLKCCDFLNSLCLLSTK